MKSISVTIVASTFLAGIFPVCWLSTVPHVAKIGICAMRQRCWYLRSKIEPGKAAILMAGCAICGRKWKLKGGQGKAKIMTITASGIYPTITPIRHYIFNTMNIRRHLCMAK
jgi:hypothetical protein